MWVRESLTNFASPNTSIAVASTRFPLRAGPIRKPPTRSAAALRKLSSRRNAR